MKTEVKKLEKCQVQLTVKLDADEMKAIVKDVEKAFVREARLPGFRPGKAPIEILRKQFAAQIKQEVERSMFQRYYADAVKAEAISEVAIADVRDMKYGDEGGEFAAIVDVAPTFKVPTYKGLKISSNDTTVKPEDVAGQVEAMRKNFATYEDAKEGDVVAEGDFVQIDYEGAVGKKPIAEIAPDAKIVAGGTGYWMRAEDGYFLPELVEAVRGMKVGETKDSVKAKFDKESAPEGLKGEKAVYKMTVKMIRHRVLPDDAALAEKAKAESFEKLTATIREQMEKVAVEQEAARRENEAVELLLKKADFDVPQSRVRRATDGFLSRFAERAQYSGLDAEYFEKNRDKILKDAEDAAVKQVRLWYVLEEIAKLEKIECSDEDLGKKAIEFVLANAKQ